jgi:hypothetical protein
MKVRLSFCSDCTVTVPDGSTHAVSVQEAKDAVEFALPLLLDGYEARDCEITGVNNYTAEEKL